MKLNKLAFACGMALAAAGMQAHAADVNLTISGSSALRPSLEKAITELCDGAVAGRNIFTSTTGKVYQCTTKPAVFGAARTIEIRKRDSGGSGLGVMNVASPPVAVGFANPASASCGAPALVTINGMQFNQRTGCADVSLVPDAGISDVEPELFASQGYKGGLNKAPLVAAMFGIPVSAKLYAKLQAVQGVAEPSLTSAQVRSLFTGDYNDWTLVNAGITPAGGALNSTAVKVCRRAATSGTQMTINARLLNSPCGEAAKAALDPKTNLSDDDSANDSSPGRTAYTGVYTAVMNPGSSEVIACLNTADDQNELAVGLLGAEFTPSASDKWRFVRLDGVAPTVPNLVSSAYDLYSEATFNRRAGGYSPDQTTLMNRLVTAIGDPANLAAGSAALPANGFTPDGVQPILKGGRNGNTCTPTVLQY